MRRTAQKLFENRIIRTKRRYTKKGWRILKENTIISETYGFKGEWVIITPPAKNRKGSKEGKFLMKKQTDKTPAEEIRAPI